MSFKWTRKIIEALIARMERHTALFDRRDGNLDHKSKRIEYQMLLEEMQLIDDRITMKDLQIKLHTLRTQYRRELRQMQQNATSKESENYEPRLWCFNQLSFLDNYVKKRSPESQVMEPFKEIFIEKSVEQLSDCESDPGMSPSGAENTDTEPAAKKIRYESLEVEKLDTQDDEEMSSPKVSAFEGQKRSEKKFSWLGHLIEAQMDEINPDDQQMVAWKIQYFMQKQILNCKQKKTNAEKLAHQIPDLSSNNTEFLKHRISNESQSIDGYIEDKKYYQ